MRFAFNHILAPKLPLETFFAKAKSLGAKITMDVMELPGIGWMSVFIDPTGAMLALWKPKSA